MPNAIDIALHQGKVSRGTPRIEGAALEAFSVDAPETFNGFMAMAGGVQTFTLGFMGQPLTVTVDVNPDSARCLQRTLEAVNGSGNQKAFNCFDHEKKAASSWPKRFYWNAEKKAVYEVAEPSKAGLEAVEGKTYRGFSLTFFTNAQISHRPAFLGGGFEIKAGAVGSPENPAHFICPAVTAQNVTNFLNMGTLTNRPAAKNNEPLFASVPQTKHPNPSDYSSQIMNKTSPTFGYGDLREGPARVLKHMIELCAQQQTVSGMDASACQLRSEKAREFAIVYRNEIRGPFDADGSPTMKPDFMYAPLHAAADTDTLGTLVGTLVTQRTLDLFRYKFPLISRIMTDMSDATGELNQTASTRKVLVPAVQTFDPTLDADGRPKGWATASAAQTADVNIVMDELVGVPIPFSMAALSSTQRQLFTEQAEAQVYALIKYYLQKIYALFTAANYNAYAAVTAADAQGIVKVPTAYVTYAVALIDFARSAAAKIGVAFDANEVPEEMRTLLLNAQYYGKATEDPSIVTFFAGQQAPEIITEGRLPNLSGFVPVKAPNFPGANNRVGIALQKNGVLAKSRLPANLIDVFPGAGNGTGTQVTDLETGFSMMLIRYINNQRGFAEQIACAIIGAAPGDARGGLVITSQ